jgi:predicted DsbA family dithiol-disulfide isomerase
MTVIEVFADVCCPFTHVGLRRLVAERAKRGTDVVLRVRAWPLELVNGAPLDAAFIAEEVDDIRRQVAPDLFTGFRESAFPASSLPALALAEAAYRVGDVLGERMSLALREALFEQGRDIGDERVLADLAAAVDAPLPDDADRARVRASWDEGRTRGVIGSPHFFTPDGGFFCPSLDIARVDGHLRITADPAGFDQFVASCFTP